MRLLLISNSTCHGSGYLDHCAAEIDDFLGDAGRVLFVPYAVFDHAGYARTARERFAELGRELVSIHELRDRPGAVAEAESFFLGGGNTFRLLSRLYDESLVGAIRERVASGAPYIGTSAGANVACPSIRTTNDMPIVEPPRFASLSLVPFQINPHYLDPDPSSTHQGETREERLREFLEENDRVVVALREGAMLRVEGDEITLLGSAGARIFERGREPRELEPGQLLEASL